MTGPPAATEVEVTLLGPGRGESVVVHLGGGEWLIVDCCASKAGGAAPLTYLDGIGVEPSSVRWLVASHWHDDHVRGFGQLVERCPRARVAQAAALERDEFLSLVVMADDLMVDGPSGVDEMRRTLGALADSGRAHPEFVRADQRLDLVAASADGPGFELWALSPSNESLAVALTDFANSGAAVDDSRRTVPRPHRNPSAVVLHVRVGDVSLLLGADLETDGSNERGWQAIVRSTGRPTQPAHFLKVPHHGSANAHDDAMWADLLVADVHAGVTPFRGGRTSLPRESDKARIAGRTPNAWLTRGSAVAGRPRRPNAVQRTLRETVRSIDVISVDPGRVTMRCDAATPGQWVVDAPSPAERLTA